MIQNIAYYIKLCCFKCKHLDTKNILLDNAYIFANIYNFVYLHSLAVCIKGQFCGLET